MRYAGDGLDLQAVYGLESPGTDPLQYVLFPPEDLLITPESRAISATMNDPQLLRNWLPPPPPPPVSAGMLALMEIEQQEARAVEIRQQMDELGKELSQIREREKERLERVRRKLAEELAGLERLSDPLFDF